MKLTYWTDFSKFINSTKIPSGGTEIDCFLKGSTDIDNPTLILEGEHTDIVYFKFNGRYYFKSSCSLGINNITEITGMHDVLATYKNDIGNLSCYVLRSASEYNPYIKDTIYPIIDEPERTITTTTTGISPFYQTKIENGSFILGILSPDDEDNETERKTIGPIIYYILNQEQLNSVRQKLYDRSIATTIANPAQYIVSCIWLPFKLTEGESVPLLIGGINMDTFAHLLADSYYEDGMCTKIHEQIVLSRHPKSISPVRRLYLNLSPYTEYMLYDYPFGNVLINPSDVYGTSPYLYIEYTLNIITGEVIAEYKYDKNETGTIPEDYDSIPTIVSANGKVGVDMMLAQRTSATFGDFAGILSNAAGFAASAYTGNVAGMIGTSAGIASGLESIAPKVQRVGANGSFTSSSKKMYLVSTFRNTVEENNEHKGRPLCEERVLNTLSGYILCDEGEIDFSCSSTDKEKISQFLTSGFFFE